MKYLVLGASGMAGHMIGIYLKEHGQDVTGFSRRTIDYLPAIYGDVANLELLKNIIEHENYDFVINAIGKLNQFAENNKAEAVFLNGYLPHYLADLCQERKTRIIHISTDCVFSGKSGDYKEDSIPDGESFYARSKAIGELTDTKNITLRTSIIGPDINSKGIGLFHWFMQQQIQAEGYTNVFWTGITTLELAEIIYLISQTADSGLYHIVNGSKISKYQLLVLINTYFKDNQIDIQKNDEFVIDKSLVRTRFDFDYIIPKYEEMLQKLLLWMKQHKQLYPHYEL